MIAGAIFRDPKHQEFLGMGWRWYPIIADARVFFDSVSFEKALRCFLRADPSQLHPEVIEVAWLGSEVVPGFRNGDLIGVISRPPKDFYTTIGPLTDFGKRWFEAEHPSRFDRISLE